MLEFILGLFIVWHGLVHLLYLGQSARRFELKPGMVWPDGSWVFSQRLGDESTRNLASVSCGLTAIGFIVGGAGLLLSQIWWRPIVAISAVFSAVLFILFWNGKAQKLDAQGGVGLLIDLALLLAALVLP